MPPRAGDAHLPPNPDLFNLIPPISQDEALSMANPACSLSKTNSWVFSGQQIPSAHPAWTHTLFLMSPSSCHEDLILACAYVLLLIFFFNPPLWFQPASFAQKTSKSELSLQQRSEAGGKGICSTLQLGKGWRSKQEDGTL